MKSITENLNLSLLEIFSVLLPGGAAILLFMQLPGAAHIISVTIPDAESDWQGALAFLGASYFIGYVLFYLGSLLDDLLYDNIKFMLYIPRDGDLKESDMKKFNWWRQWVIWFDKIFIGIPATGIIDDLFKGKSKLFKEAVVFKKIEINDESADVINLYKWTIAKLMISYPEMYAVVERHQAASKFFRSMVIVFLFAIILFFCISQPLSGMSSIALLFLSMLIYLQQRFKAIRTAYEYIIVVSNLKQKVA